MKNLLFLLGFILIVASGFSQKPDTSGSIQTNYDKAPEFPGGMESLYKFISNTVSYPIDAVEEAIQGKVIVQFVVDEEGSVVNAIIKKSVSASLDKEALRVVRSMPKWEPATQNNKPVKVYYNLPISFKLQ